jgi:hypothetical protein
MVAAFDIDEFVLPHKHATFRDFLLAYDRCDGIGINWVMFGDGHHKTRPAGGVIENYLYREHGSIPASSRSSRTDKLVGCLDNAHSRRSARARSTSTRT